MNNRQNIKTIIVDDEPQCILRLQNDLTALGDFEVTATTSSPMSAKTLVMSMQPDVLFIDMEMPGQTGLEILQTLQDEMPPGLIVVFYSSFDKYMIDALRASAFDFLLKPYQKEELETVVERIRKKMSNMDRDHLEEDGLSQRLQGLDDFVGGTSKPTAVQTISGLLMVKPADVFCFSFDADNHLWTLRMTNGTVHKLKKQTIAKTILSISPSLTQIRQDCIINLDYLVGIENYTLHCLFVPPFDQEEITISRRCYKAVKEKLEIL